MKQGAIETIADLRWKLFSQNQKSIENLPPTEDALYCKILRSHHMTYLLKNSLSPCFYKPDPTLYGWRYYDSKLVPIPSINTLPAPVDMLTLTICSCKSSCSTNRCKCKKYLLTCTDACRCTECENIAQEEEFETCGDPQSDRDVEYV